MNLNDWREERIKPLDLPSGLTVKVRKVNLIDLAMNGTIPNPLMAVADEVEKGRDPTMLEIYAHYGPLVHLVCVASLVEPLVAETADETHICIDELSASDRLAIFNYSNGEVFALTPFRKTQEQPAEPVPTEP